MSKRFASTVTAASFLLALGVLATADAAAATPAAAADTVEADTITVELSPKAESGVRARARLVHDEDHVRVGIAARGIEVGDEYPAHIHRGTCEEGGGVVADVGPVTRSAEDGDVGQATATVPVEELKQAKEESEAEHPSFFLQIHLPDGTPAACGDVVKEEKEKEEMAEADEG